MLSVEFVDMAELRLEGVLLLKAGVEFARLCASVCIGRCVGLELPGVSCWTTVSDFERECSMLAEEGARRICGRGEGRRSSHSS